MSRSKAPLVCVRSKGEGFTASLMYGVANGQPHMVMPLGWNWFAILTYITILHLDTLGTVFIRIETRAPISYK